MTRGWGDADERSKFQLKEAERSPAASLLAAEKDRTQASSEHSLSSDLASSAGSMVATATNLMAGSMIVPLQAAYVWGSLGVSAVLHSIWSMNKVRDAQRDADGNADPVVKQHNYYRCLHGVGPLVFNSALADNAQVWADQANAANLQHSDVNSRTDVASFRYVGENLAQVETPPQAVDLWYSEIANTQNSTGAVESFSSDTGHYTQVVWKDSTDIGCAYKEHLVVCQYGPGGNVAGRYETNVYELMRTDQDCNYYLK